MKKIAVLGSGIVGQVLADGFLKHGHEVMRGSRDPKKLADWKKAAAPRAQIGTFTEAARFGEIVVLAVKGTAAAEALGSVAAEVKGKTVIDTTNPIADVPPAAGVLSFFTGPGESLLERLVAAAPTARLVKAFSSVGNGNFVNPDFGAVRPTMFICGADADAKAEVAGVLEVFGWETADMGGPEAARAIEPLCMLWCIPGFRENSWTHAFKLLRR